MGKKIVAEIRLGAPRCAPRDTRPAARSAVGHHKYKYKYKYKNRS